MYPSVEKTWTGVKRQTSSTNREGLLHQKVGDALHEYQDPERPYQSSYRSKIGNTTLINVAVLDTGVDAAPTHPT